MPEMRALLPSRIARIDGLKSASTTGTQASATLASLDLENVLRRSASRIVGPRKYEVRKRIPRFLYGGLTDDAVESDLVISIHASDCDRFREMGKLDPSERKRRGFTGWQNNWKASYALGKK